MNNNDAAKEWTLLCCRSDQKDKQIKAKVPMHLGSPLADVVDDGDVGEEVVVFRRRHGSPQGVAILKVAHQDAQAVQVRVLRSDDLKDGLWKSGWVQGNAEAHFTFFFFFRIYTFFNNKDLMYFVFL